MSTEVRVGIIAGSAEVIVALIALFGVLASAGDADEGQSGFGRSAPTTVSGESSVSCADIIERYRTLVFLDPTLLDALVTAGPDDISPVGADPDARRCGLSEAALRAMR